MRIEITGDVEKLIEAELASGKFRSPAEFVESLVRDWRRTHNGDASAVVPLMPEHFDVDELAKTQRVEPCDDPSRLQTDIWPEDESVDDFVEFLRQSRSDRREARAM